MSSPRPASDSATRPVLGLLAIPLVSVTSAALIGDVASSNDPRRVAWGMLGLAAGTLGGLALVRLASIVTAGLNVLAEALVAWASSATGWVLNGGPRPVTPAAVCVPAGPPALGSIVRRGPPDRSV